MIPHVRTNQTLTVLLDSRSICIPVSHVNFEAIIACLSDDDPTELRQLLDVKQAVSDFTQGKIEINDRVLTYAGTPINTSLTKKIIEFMRSGEPDLAGPLINFLDKLMLNPSHRAVQGLYDWVAVSNMPIAADGDVYAWKIVKGDYFDYYSGTLDHTPGNVVTQTRNLCDEDPDRTCSNGIHFCSFNYLPQYHRGDESRRVMLVKIDPADVVAIPREYGTAKGRCCKLTVIQQVPQEELETFFPTRTVYVPAPLEKKQTFVSGQVWIGNDDEEYKIDDVWQDGIFDAYRVEDGDLFDFDAEGYCEDTDVTLVSLNKPEAKFKVGQVWIDCDGDHMTVTEFATNGNIVSAMNPLGPFYLCAPDGSPLPGLTFSLDTLHKDV